MKAVFLTALTSSQDLVKQFFSLAKPYGLEVSGHFWIDDLPKMAWAAPLDILTDPKTVLWAIIGGKTDFEKPDIRYGLALLALAADARKPYPLKILILHEGETGILTDDLPTPLKNAEIFTVSDKGLGAKLVARAHQQKSALPREYFIDFIGSEQIGQWFEIRPAAGSWSGAMFGAAGGEILFQAVGPAGRLPEKTVLHYPMQGMKLTLGGVEYTAWAAQNEINLETSYYAKVDGNPSAILFGPYSDEAAADVYAITLK